MAGLGVVGARGDGRGDGLNRTSAAPTASEHDEQAAFVAWCAWQKYPGLEFGFAVPNGGSRHVAVAVKLKAEGVRRGVLDWYCPKRMHGFTGLAIEFKVGRNKLTPEQRLEVDFLRGEGWFVEVCYSADEAIAVVKRYFRSST